VRAKPVRQVGVLTGKLSDQVVKDLLVRGVPVASRGDPADPGLLLASGHIEQSRSTTSAVGPHGTPMGGLFA
jgi:hypothetical protein